MRSCCTISTLSAHMSAAIPAIRKTAGESVMTFAPDCTEKDNAWRSSILGGRFCIVC